MLPAAGFNAGGRRPASQRTITASCLNASLHAVLQPSCLIWRHCSPVVHVCKGKAPSIFGAFGAVEVPERWGGLRQGAGVFGGRQHQAALQRTAQGRNETSD